jgi:transposase-like protein
MPAHENEHTTSTPAPTTSAESPAQLPTQSTFHQHLREQIRSAVQVVMEEVMREELSHFLQAEWGENSPKRQGYRNGSYTPLSLTYFS